MDFEQFFDFGDRRGNNDYNDSSDSFNPLELLMDEFIDRQFGGNNPRQNHNRNPEQQLNRKADSIAENLDFGYIDDAMRQLDRNIPKYGNRLVNRVQQFESPGYGADLEAFPVLDQSGRQSNLVRMVFPFDRSLACQDIGLVNRRRYTSLTHTQPYFCPSD